MGVVRGRRSIRAGRAVPGPAVPGPAVPGPAVPGRGWGGRGGGRARPVRERRRLSIGGLSEPFPAAHLRRDLGPRPGPSGGARGRAGCPCPSARSAPGRGALGGGAPWREPPGRSGPCEPSRASPIGRSCGGARLEDRREGEPALARARAGRLNAQVGSTRRSAQRAGRLNAQVGSTRRSGRGAALGSDEPPRGPGSPGPPRSGRATRRRPSPVAEGADPQRPPGAAARRPRARRVSPSRSRSATDRRLSGRERPA